jgi:hypothetical protein
MFLAQPVLTGTGVRCSARMLFLLCRTPVRRAPHGVSTTLGGEFVVE